MVIPAQGESASFMCCARQGAMAIDQNESNKKDVWSEDSFVAHAHNHNFLRVEQKKNRSGNRSDFRLVEILVKIVLFRYFVPAGK